MSGLIAIPCRNEQGRFVDTYRSILAMEMPPNTKVQLYPGWFPHVNRCVAAQEALDKGHDWVFFVDDDQILPPHALVNLLKHDVDIVSCNLLTRSSPFNPYLFSKTLENGQGFPDILTGKSGLIEVEAIGLGGVLVKTEVFRKLEKPWFDINKDLQTDDFYFSWVARKAGIKIHYDLETPSGHIVLAVVWPTKDAEGNWKTSIIINNSAKVDLAAPVKNEKGEIYING